jgi:hypothetical protein
MLGNRERMTAAFFLGVVAASSFKQVRYSFSVDIWHLAIYGVCI